MFLNDVLQAINWFGSKAKCSEDFTHTTEVLDASEERNNFPEMNAVTSEKIRGCFKNDTFKVIFKKDFLKDENVLPSRFDKSVKSNENKKERNKARVLIGEYKNKLKNMMAHFTI